VLSKVAFFENGSDRPDPAVERARLLPALLNHLRSSDPDAEAAPALGGTLGLCFDVDIEGKRQFLKSHLPTAAARASLASEAEILLRLYGDTVVRERFDVPAPDGTTRLCLLMPTLAPLAVPMQPEDAAAMARGWNDRLEGYRPGRSLEEYVTGAARALATLSGRDLLERGTSAEVRLLLSRLEDRLADLPRLACHGDFGPRNVMTLGDQRLAIDWEDAFWGVAGYDYLYWLTFMENRPFLQRAAFGRTGLEPDIERAILALVVLLKSYLAVCSGAYLNHAVSAQARIAEVLELER
jgi:hypothetical protein